MMKKRALITGSAQGIGRCLAEGFAKAGYEVFALDLQQTTFKQEHIHFFQADLKNEEEVKRCFRKIRNDYGQIHVLINNGAVSQFHKPIDEIAMEEFDRVIHTNLRGAFLCCREFVRQARQLEYGRIINIASTRFHQNEKDWEAYGASKGGIVSLTYSLCISLSNTNITVNAVTPGWIETKNYDALTKEDHLQHPCGRVGRPQDILRICLFLCDEENDFIDGANIVADGGMSKKMIYVE